MFGRLGGASPAADVLADAYIAQVWVQARCRIIIANRGAAATIRLAHAPNGAADSPDHYLLYDFPLDANASIATEEIAVAAGDKLRVRSSTGDVTFTVNGQEERIRR